MVRLSMGHEAGIWQTLQFYSSADEQTLVQAASAGHALAQRALLERYLPLIYAVCRRQGLRTQDADDVTQDIVVKLLRTLHQFRGESKLSSWIYTLAQRAVADYFRAGARREISHDFSDEQQAVALHDAASDDGNDERRDADRVTQILGELGEPLRSVMLRYYLADESVGEIADALKLPQGTVKTHLFRGRQLVREKLEVAHAL